MEIEGFVDQLTPEGLLSGWVRDLADPERRVRVEARLGGVLVGGARADRHRPDLQAAGLAHGEYGYEVRLGSAVMQSGAERGLELVVTAKDRELGRVGLGGRDLPAGAANVLGRLLGRIALRSSEGERRPAEGDPPHPDPVYRPLFTPATTPRPLGPHPLSAFVDSTRHRHGGAFTFDPARYAADVDGCYLWYLEVFSAKQKPRAVPLSHADLRYLNTPAAYGPDGRCLTRVMLAHLLATGAGERVSALQDEERYGELLQWWAGEADRLGVEDCLMPELLRSSLREVKPSARNLRLPLSAFMERHRRAVPELQALGSPSGFGVRAAVYLHLLLLSAERPALASYLPAKGLAELRDKEGGESVFDQLMRQAAGSGASVTYADLAALLGDKGFDLDSQAFRTLDARGDRLQAAALVRPSAAERCDVQLIGPLSKASGLGQAARLSARLLQGSGLNVGLYDFSLENPAPVVDAAKDANVLRRARINLIHLNAESAPLAFAMLPDVFSDAHNIIYPFWELSAPAPAQMLGLELADELWVASAFGQETFAPYTDKPVTTVGMTFETDAPPRGEARAALERRFPTWRNCFVFLSTFDAFSYVQRKNPLGVIEAFLTAFPEEPDVRLLLKTHNRDYVRQPQQRKVWAEVSRLVEADSRIELLNETLSYRQVLELKRGCDCYVSLHRSEGWGFGLLEAMGLGVPVVATGYSGNMDFCSPETAFLVDHDLVPVRHGEYAYASEGQVWAEPRPDSAAEALRRVARDPEERERRTARAFDEAHRRFGEAAVGERYRRRLREILAAREGGS